MYGKILYIIICFLGIQINSFSQSLSPNDSALFSKAVNYYDQGNFKSSYEILAKLINNGVKDPKIYYYIGLIYHNINNYEEAKKFYNLALQEDSTYSAPYSDISVILMNEGNLDAAIISALKAINFDSTYIKGYLNLGAAYLRSGQSDLAESTFYKAAILNPNEVSNLGNILLLQYNNPKAAIYYYKISLSAYPDHLLSLLNLGNSYRILDEYDEALKYLEYGYNLGYTEDSTYSIIYSTYMRLLFDLKKYDKVLNRSFEKFGENYPHAHFFNALVYYVTNQKDKFEQSALEYFRLNNENVPKNLNEWAESKILKKY